LRESRSLFEPVNPPARRTRALRKNAFSARQVTFHAPNRTFRPAQSGIIPQFRAFNATKETAKTPPSVAFVALAKPEKWCRKRDRDMYVTSCITMRFYVTMAIQYRQKYRLNVRVSPLPAERRASEPVVRSFAETETPTAGITILKSSLRSAVHSWTAQVI
jgi:hypothetical protein